jgi:glycosyltransferase involved in cell wall biosynthesis
MFKITENEESSAKNITTPRSREQYNRCNYTPTDNVLDVSFSVIVPVKGQLNRKWLEYLDSIFPPNSEIILIGENILDRHKISCKTILVEAKCNRSQARNLGLSICKGDIVFFLDADQIPSKRLVRETVELFRKEYEMIKIPERFIGVTQWSKALALWKMSVQEADRKYGCIPRIYSRKVFSKIGSFDADLDILEDFILYLRAQKAGLKEVWASSPLYHIEPHNIREIIKKSDFYINALRLLNKKNVGDRAILEKYVKAIYVFVKAMSSKEELKIKIGCATLVVFRICLLIFSLFKSMIHI